MRPSKHVDILAITLLLMGVAILSQARQSHLIRYHSARLVEFTNRQVLTRLSNPRLPKLCLIRD